MPLSGSLSGPIAYLTAEYPRATDTFIQREVAALRDRGFEVLTTTIRATDAAHHVGEEQRRIAAETFQIQTAAKRPLALLKAQFRLLRARPGGWLGGLGLAIRTSPPGPRALLWQLFYFLEAGVLADHLRSQGAVHLHSHFGDTSTSVAMITSRIAGIPFSYTLHGPSIFFAPQRWRLDAKTARAAFVACISHFARSQAMLFSDPAHWDKLRIVHCGVDPARYDHGARETRGQNLLFVGRLAPEKGLLVLLDAFARCRAAHPAARLTLIGDGPERPAIEARVAEMGLAQAVTFAGYCNQDEVATTLAETDIFALPSFAEGVPVVLMEAMASRVPVVTTRIAGVGELVEDGVSGHLVPPGDAESFAAAVLALLGDPDAARAMGEAGRAKVVAEYNSPDEAARLGALLEGSAEPGAIRVPNPETPAPVIRDTEPEIRAAR